MNFEKWADLTIPLAIFSAKLSEECGEVANHVADAYFDKTAKRWDTRALQLIEELEQVIFIANVTIAKLKADGGEAFNG